MALVIINPINIIKTSEITADKLYFVYHSLSTFDSMMFVFNNKITNKSVINTELKSGK